MRHITAIECAILDLIATPEAMAPFDHPDDGRPSRVGLPVDALFGALFKTYSPKRRQYVAVYRAINVLRADRLVEVYSRSACPKRHVVAEYNWKEAILSWECCGWPHFPTTVIALPATGDENTASPRHDHSLENAR